jgi:hypothetical protein
MALTGYGTKDTVIGLMRRGVSDYLEKPFHMNEFLARMTKLRDQVLSLAGGFSGMAWGSPDAEVAYHAFREGRKAGLREATASGRTGTVQVADCALIGKFKQLESSGEEREFASACSTPWGCDLLVAEVEGRDMEAFYQLVLIKSFFEHHCLHPMHPGSFLRFLNRLLLDDSLERRRVKVLFASMNRKESRAEVFNAGGLPAFFLNRESDSALQFTISGMPLGQDRAFHAHSESVAVHSGDRLFLATEGLCLPESALPGPERENVLGQDGLEALILAHRHLSLEDSVETIWKDALACSNPYSMSGGFFWGVEIP